MNVFRKIQENEDIIGPLIRSLLMQYPRHTFSFMPIIIGATGYRPTCLNQRMTGFGSLGREGKSSIHSLKMIVICGIIKISRFKKDDVKNKMLFFKIYSKLKRETEYIHTNTWILHWFRQWLWQSFFQLTVLFHLSVWMCWCNWLGSLNRWLF